MRIGGEACPWGPRGRPQARCRSRPQWGSRSRGGRAPAPRRPRPGSRRADEVFSDARRGPSPRRAASSTASRRTPRPRGWCRGGDPSAGRPAPGPVPASPAGVVNRTIEPAGPSVIARIETRQATSSRSARLSHSRRLQLRTSIASANREHGRVAVEHVPHRRGEEAGRPPRRRAAPARPAGSAARRRPGGRTAARTRAQRLERGVAAAEADRQLVAELAAGDQQGPVGRACSGTRIGRWRIPAAASRSDDGAARRVVLGTEGADQLAAQRRGEARPHPAEVVVPGDARGPSAAPTGRAARHGVRQRRPSRTGPASRPAARSSIRPPSGSTRVRAASPELPACRRRSDRGAGPTRGSTSGRSTRSDPVEVGGAEDLDRRSVMSVIFLAGSGRPSGRSVGPGRSIILDRPARPRSLA